MKSGSLADAMRATMSLPLAFPPVEVEGKMLVDGGVMINVPADVVRAMGAGALSPSTSAICPRPRASTPRCSASPARRWM